MKLKILKHRGRSENVREGVRGDNFTGNVRLPRDLAAINTMQRNFETIRGKWEKEVEAVKRTNERKCKYLGATCLANARAE